MPEPISSPFKLLPTQGRMERRKKKGKKEKTTSKPRVGFFLFFLNQTHGAQVS